MLAKVKIQNEAMLKMVEQNRRKLDKMHLLVRKLRDDSEENSSRETAKNSVFDSRPVVRPMTES